MHDLYGLPITCDNDATRQGIDDFIHGFISFQTKATNVLAAATNDPENALANAYAAILYMLLEAPVAPKKAAPFLANAQRAKNITPREAATVKAAHLFVTGEIPILAKAGQIDDPKTHRALRNNSHSPPARHGDAQARPVSHVQHR